MRRKKFGFTLIELLVVVTIIVILLALLVPAMDKAIYQAELVQCAGKLKAVAGTVTIYAFENKRYYPDRGLQKKGPKSGAAFITPNGLALGAGEYEIRPLLSRMMDINTTLQCPFVEPIDLVNTNPQTNVSASYSMWWAWQYKTSDGNIATTGAGQANVVTYRGMFKVGDRFEWTEGGVTDRYRLLVGDSDLDQVNGVSGSHPDKAGLLASQKFENEFVPGANSFLSVSSWARVGNPERGLIDMNQAFDDGAVLRYNDVIGHFVAWKDRDRRMGAVPMQFDDKQPGKRFQIPRD